MTNDRTARTARPQRLSPSLWLTAALGALVLAPMPGAAQGPGTEGAQWTFLGGDAWHTRYTPADQISASNFGDLEVVWRWAGKTPAPP